jgi:hypothetical protein
MDPLLIAAAVVTLIQGIKEAAEKVGIVIQGPVALIFTILACVGYVLYKALETSVPIFSIVTLVTLVQVIIGALGGYGIVKKIANGKTVPPTPVP